MFLVVFRSRKRTDIDQAAYDAESVRMEALAREQPGYRAFKSYLADDRMRSGSSAAGSTPPSTAWTGTFDRRAATRPP